MHYCLHSGHPEIILLRRQHQIYELSNVTVTRLRYVLGIFGIARNAGRKFPNEHSILLYIKNRTRHNHNTFPADAQR